MCGCNKNKGVKKISTHMSRLELAKRMENLKAKISKTSEVKK